MSGDLADRPWVELFPQRAVRAVSGEPAVLIELVPAPGVPPFIVQAMLFQRIPGFLAWEWCKVTHGHGQSLLMRPLRDRSRSVGIALAAVLAIVGIVALGALISLLPRTGLDCPEPGARVMLDPGHGGDDPGAINEAAGLVERELVLDIARRTEALLEEAGLFGGAHPHRQRHRLRQHPTRRDSQRLPRLRLRLDPPQQLRRTGAELRQDVLGDRGEGRRLRIRHAGGARLPAATGDRPGRLRSRGAGERRATHGAHAGGAGRAGLSLQSGGGGAARRPWLASDARRLPRR